MDCFECGAPDKACEARFHEFLVKEFDNSAFGTVHHLTVASYMLQHSSNLTRAGWLHMRQLLREFLVEEKSPTTIRKQNKDLLVSGKRNYRIKSRDGSPVIQREITWTKTILDVRLDNAKVYCEDVTAWAKSVLDDADKIQLW